ncbi:DUF421 domain-containing protein [Flavobacterium stagni]|uniref:DUF421 domain-containing protein n=1 Tax=Flavobacterium stagni TaxID=2506421 RepID=A0A4V1N2Q0_9FLAO|nr:YetF domain-containing protein [Flavobacterium stagni]RXR22881.1 DUF421 domain-containing protein [Flavobacterium stagni]
MNAYFDIIFRSVCVYLFMIAAIRLFGKKELSQLNTADVILILLISNAVQNAMVGSNTGLIGGLVAALALFIINFFFKKLMFYIPALKKLVQDKPEILVHNGTVEFKTLAKLGITHDELMEAIREHGIEHYQEVRLAMLEIDGNISVISGDTQLKQTKHKRRIHKTLGNV